MAALLLLAFLIVAGAPASGASELRAEAFAQSAFDDGAARLEARLLLHPDRRPDGTVRAGVLLTLDPGWFVAWRSPGDGGLATQLRWRGADAGPIEWPAPDVVPAAAAAFVRYGFTGDVLLVSELVPRAGAERIEVEVESLVCATACVPVSLSLGRDLARAEPPDTVAAVRRLFARHAEARPRPPAEVGREVELRALGGERFALLLGRCNGAATCPTLGAPRFAAASDRVRVLDAREAAGEVVVLLERERGAPSRIEGVLSVSDADGRSHHLAIAVAPRGARAAHGTVLGAFCLAAFLLGAAMSALPSRLGDLLWMREAESPARLARHGFGLALSVLALAGLGLGARHVILELIGIDAPLVALAAAVVCVVASVHLFAGGSTPALSTHVPPDGTTIAGGLRALHRARRCLLPLLAPALALACFVDAGAVLAAALGLALGLDLAARVLLQRPLWLANARSASAELRRVLGFVPLAGASWLVARLASTAGGSVAGWALAGLLATALVAWVFGSVAAPRLRVAVLALAACLATLVGLHIAEPPHAGAVPKPWTPDTFAELRTMHRPVLVVYGADWCLPCRWNEEAVVASAPVRHALVRGGYTVLRADWTDRDEAVRRELARFGRAGVPLTLVYPPGAGGPVRLPDVLTEEALLGAL